MTKALAAPPKNPAGKLLFRGEYLKDSRILRGMNLHDLGQMVGVNGATVHKWEAGKIEPRPHNVKRLSEALGVPIVDLYFRNGVQGKTNEPKAEKRNRRSAAGGNSERATQ